MSTDPTSVWRAILALIQDRVSADGFERWFSGIRIVSGDGKYLRLKVPNSIHQFFIESNYMSLLKTAVEEIIPGGREIQFILQDHEKNLESTPLTQTTAISEESPRSTPKDTAAKDKNISVGIGTGMHSGYTFESFVVGPNNQFAYAAALAVAQSPAKTYNPLFVYGDSGLGKTHLLQAIGYQVLTTKKNAKVVYLSSEQFTNEFIDAIQHGTLFKFRKRYRQADVLMIDDIHFLAGKERSQEEFFHTFNTLHDGHKQIVLSSDRPASEIEKLEQRLVSRFEWGMTAELQPPDMETRVAILQSIASSMHIFLEAWLIEFLADKIRNNIRRLKGALVRVAGYKSLSERPLNVEIVENLLRDILQEQARRVITIDQIQRKVAEHFDVRIADMTSKRRPAAIAFPRQVAMYLARELTSCSLNEIGDAFGGKDHGTVIHAIKLVKKRMESDDKTRHIVLSLDSQLQR
ncbi:MAG: chromosomal replication initiator protein DnaA [Verrucomicrobia bacterium]|nr:MAG: chromosomal replication initiator protein DnaA [Verrucomicrobiota bacterium]